TFCDLACPECISGRLLNQGRFSKERLHQLAGELAAAGVKAVVLIGGGEPLAHAGTGGAIPILRPAKLRIGLGAHGAQIDHHLGALTDGVDWVRVSVDAATSETFGMFRPNRGGVSVFDSVIANIELLACRSKTYVGYSFLLLSRMGIGGRVEATNFHEVF